MDTNNIDSRHITEAARDLLTVKRVFGEAYEKDGTLVIPVAKVVGGTGSGWGGGEMRGGEVTGVPTRRHESAESAGAGLRTPDGGGSGGGGGFGVRVKAIGVYTVDESGTRWQPALDLNRVIIGGQAVAVVLALAVGWAVGRRRKR